MKRLTKKKAMKKLDVCGTWVLPGNYRHYLSTKRYGWEESSVVADRGNLKK